MNPALREYVLSLPLDVRQELCKAKCAAAYVVVSCHSAWELVRMSPDVAPLYLCSVEAASSTVFAVLPVSPIDIALHAAKLAGRDRSHWVSVSVMPCFSFEHSMAYMASNPSPRHQSDIGVEHQSVMDDDSDCDPTGHRAAIALLQKAMEAKAS